VSFSINPTAAATLAAKSYWAAIQVASSSVVDSPQTFIVVLDVAPATSPSVPVPTPAGLLFLSNGASPPAPQTVHVYASSQTPLTYQASSDSPWLLPSSASGSTYTASPAAPSVSVNPSGLAVGVYRGSVSYALSSAAVRTINVTLVVEAAASYPQDRTAKAVTCSPTQLAPTQTGLVNNFSQPTGFPTPLSVQLVDNCGNPIANGAVDATFSNGDPPLALVATDTTTGIYSGTWTPRSTSGQVTINARATAAGFPAVSVQILGQVTPNPAPLLTPNGTLDAFAIAAEPGAPIAPGTIVQIYGSNLASQTTSATTIPLPTSLNQTSVIIGGLMAPLYFASPGQINAQVPFELTAGNPYQVIVDANGALSTPNPIQLTNDAPGIAQFAAGQIIAQHLSNNNLVTETSPAAPGETIVFYVAGMGLTSPGVASGIASPSTNLAVPIDTPALTLNGAPVPAANIIFAGLTPTLVGLYQVDFTVPANAPNGDLPLVLTQTSGLSNSTILPVHQ
jgi:adhesin/invasin